MEYSDKMSRHLVTRFHGYALELSEESRWIVQNLFTF